MNGRTLPTAIGAGITTFLLVAVALVGLLDFEFSAVVALPIGLLAGLAVLAGTATSIDRAGAGVRRFASAYAAFGLVISGLLVLRYVNVGRSVLSTDLVFGVGVAAALAVYAVLFVCSRSPVR